MSDPKRIQRKRAKGWRMPKNTVSVTRPGKWGNPFTVEHRMKHMNMTREQAQEHATKTFSRCLLGIDEPCDPGKANRITWIIRNIQELRGKNIACFCKEGDPCHGDVLLEIANK